MPGKRCTHCGETKPVAEFYRNKNRRDGLHSWCRECHGANNRIYLRRVRATTPSRQIQRYNTATSFRLFRDDPEFWAIVERLDSKQMAKAAS